MNQPQATALRRELTVRGILLGIAITVLFTAANVYFGLKAGLTFATSIPAAVISMAILQGFRGASIQENNIVQTVASSAGTQSAIIFVLPGLVMVGWWQGFPFWTSLLLCALGGILGVMYTIPLRRALVTGSDLPYPEGVACAEVLKVGTASQNGERTGLKAIVLGALVSSLFALGVAMKLFAGGAARFFRLGEGGAVTGAHFSLSFALLAIGHLVGLSVGLAILVGTLIAWGWAVPHYTALLGNSPGDIATAAHTAWTTQVRFIGAGTIGIAALWALLRLLGPLVNGLRSALKASRLRHQGRGAALPRTERDIPIGLVAGISLLCLFPIGALLVDFTSHAGLVRHQVLLVGGALLFLVLVGLLVAAVCGYMAGLIGSSNSPLSGVGILVVVIAALLLVALSGNAGVGSGAEGGKPWIAFALFVTTLVFTVATIANDNLQDLKTGQLVDATPWKQQVALVIGVVAGAAIIPPTLTLLNQAYGFAGMPGAGPQALPAPQASLISTLAEKVIDHNLDWGLLGLGIAIGAVLIVIDELLARYSRAARLPPLAAGLGIYLPTATTLMISLGAIVGWLFNRYVGRRENLRRLGVLLASGMIVGEGILGVVLAALVVFSGNPAPLAVTGPGFAPQALWLGFVVFAVAGLWCYRWAARQR